MSCSYYISPGREAPGERETYFREPFPDSIVVPSLNLDCAKINWIPYMLSVVYSRDLNLDDFHDWFALFFDLKYGIFPRTVQFLVLKRVRGDNTHSLANLAIGEQWLARRDYLRLNPLVERLSELVIDIQKLKTNVNARRHFVELFLTDDQNSWCIGRRFRLTAAYVENDLIPSVYRKFSETRTLDAKHASAATEASRQILSRLADRVQANADEYHPFREFLTETLGVTSKSDIARLLGLREGVRKHPLILNLEKDLKRENFLPLDERMTAHLVYGIIQRGSSTVQARKLFLTLLICSFVREHYPDADLYLELAKCWSDLTKNRTAFNSFLKNMTKAYREFGLSLNLRPEEIWNDILTQSLWLEFHRFMDTAESLVRCVLKAISTQVHPITFSHVETQLREKFTPQDSQFMAYFLQGLADGKYDRLNQDLNDLIASGIFDEDKANSYRQFLLELKQHARQSKIENRSEALLKILFTHEKVRSYGIKFDGVSFVNESGTRFEEKGYPVILQVLVAWVNRELRMPGIAIGKKDTA